MEKPKVYSKEDCVKCNATYRSFAKEGIDYDLVMLEEHPELVEQFREEGLVQAPIVEANGERWSGFRPDKIKALGGIAIDKSQEL